MRAAATRQRSASGAQALAALARFSLTCTDAEALALFYEGAFGGRRLQAGRREGRQFEQLLAVRGGARAVTLALGAQVLELLQFDHPGQPYPRDASAADLGFQHFAILVTDMQQAYRRLTQMTGWTAITREGPQQLPQRSGGVTAFKFRDPEGHPLELLAMPALSSASVPYAPYCGIDHSAISVSDTMQSVAFYEALGLRLGATSYNHGIEQEKLDDVAAPHVDVTALSPLQARPHLELLCYRRPRPPTAAAAANNDIVATRLIFQREANAASRASVHVHRIDPDGHHLIIE